ncbi:MAG: metabolite traffic protein EboE [Verrucomicrobiales bacterium]|nr:metabolite traffic protein EboE [Verrucomicrobiales bacterium]
MRLKHGIHLGYCTNIHRGETWDETFAALRTHTNAVRLRVAPDEPYGIGLRLGAAAAEELAAKREERDAFRRWLDKTNSYVFTINGFPYGAFHGTRVKEQVFAPDWSTEARLVYTNRLFDLLDEIAPAGIEASVSTLPGSFKEFIRPETSAAQLEAIRRNLRSCAHHIASIREKSGRDLHLGLEPEPLGLFENSAETVDFFGSLLEGSSGDERDLILRHVGVNYDTCHLAIEYEEPGAAIGAMRGAGIRISKIHLSSALKLRPNPTALSRLRQFQEGVYFHQVLVAEGGVVVRRFKDLPDALTWNETSPDEAGDEWRVHFHVPLHTSPEEGFGDTRDHLSGLLGAYAADPGWCRHFEFETYTWEVLPPALRARDVVDQLTAEYGWCLAEFEKHGLR